MTTQLSIHYKENTDDVGEIADVAKTARFADKAIGTANAARKAVNIATDVGNAVDTAKTAPKVVDTLKTADNVVSASGKAKGIGNLNVQLFAEKDIGKQSVNSLKKGISSLETRIGQHKNKIMNPEKYVSGWELYTEEHKKGLLKHWNKEIQNFENSISDRINELNKRGWKY